MIRLMTGFRVRSTGCYVMLYKRELDEHVQDSLLAAYYDELQEKIDRLCDDASTL